ncbi:uncharacterized protein TRUGW13939_07099 [Talaromyces rugulosus]|uniref:Short chain dehydrogenase/reductase n=1 Tax=Talaromyces rugulosus TaxID=121627 RepID=A0A7H8R187_TALRU|nr:uncharacterized protein TRUGW13939_07099 [Talaromyces rugulosus]QKX59957.1 hypothetical protein TRUGW13939_07099 [Talaromyces rugulosus]
MSAQTQKKVFIVTGGASGIGLGITRFLASQTHATLTPVHISIFDINATAAAQTVSTLQQEFPAISLSSHQCDVASWESQAAAFEDVVKHQGRVDYVFANAGVTERGTLIDKNEEKPSKPVLATLDVNLSGVIYSIKLAIHYMLKNAPNSSGSKGGIICTASNAGIYSFPMAPFYATAKHGVVGLVRSLAKPLGLEGIQINGLAPAVVETNIASDGDLFKHMIITPMSTVTRAVETLLTDSSLTGKIAELYEGNVTFVEQPAYADENVKKNIEMFWNLGYA